MLHLSRDSTMQQQLNLRKPNGNGFPLFACFRVLLVAAATVTVSLLQPPHEGIRTQIFSLPTRNENQWLSRNPPGLRQKMRTAEASGLVH